MRHKEPHPPVKTVKLKGVPVNGTGGMRDEVQPEWQDGLCRGGVLPQKRWFNSTHNLGHFGTRRTITVRCLGFIIVPLLHHRKPRSRRSIKKLPTARDKEQKESPRRSATRQLSRPHEWLPESWHEQRGPKQRRRRSPDKRSL